MAGDDSVECQCRMAVSPMAVSPARNLPECDPVLEIPEARRRAVEVVLDVLLPRGGADLRRGPAAGDRQLRVGDGDLESVVDGEEEVVDDEEVKADLLQPVAARGAT